MKNKTIDKKIESLKVDETKRQKETLQLIPSENFTSKKVRAACGSIFSHKYSEGQVGKRYYEGNKIIDKLESLCKNRALKLFGLQPRKWHVNVQSYSGSIANLAVINSLLNPGDTILSLKLTHGGHLSHGWQFNRNKTTHISEIYNIEHYFVDEKSFRLNYDSIRRIAETVKPDLLISGGTSLPEDIDYQRFRQIADSVKAKYLADISHEAGLIAAEVLKEPFRWADFVTTTTHKTLRGPKGALIFCKNDFAKQIDKAVFPGLQGGPNNNNIAGIAVCLKEASTKTFRVYANQVKINAKSLATELKKHNFNLVSQETEKHLLLIDLRNKNIDGRSAALALATAGINVNKNTIPYETNTPIAPSGIRLGTPFETTRGLKETEMKKIASWINKVIEVSNKIRYSSFHEFKAKLKNIEEMKEIRKSVRKMCSSFKLPF